MNARDAERYVYRVVAYSLGVDLTNGASWLNEATDTRAPMSDADVARVRSAAERVVTQLERKAARLNRRGERR